MGNILKFSGEVTRSGFERVKSRYTVREISRQFGLSERYVRKWTREGLVPIAPDADREDPRYDFRALTGFRRVRELRSQGLTIRQVEAELRGQMNLFPPPSGELIQLPIKRSPFEEALRLHDSGDPRAAESYREAIRQNDYVADAYCNLGILEFETGNQAAAFDKFTKALAQDPRHFESHFNLANLYFECGDTRLALLHYQVAAEIEPAFPDLYFNLGILFAMSQDLDAALTALRRARELLPADESSRVDDLLASVEKASQIRS
jgi:tetratricopeptide (TPR) repeat protein